MGDLSRLNESSTRLFEARTRPEMLAEILDATIVIQGADFGSFQIFDPERGSLRIAAQRGFPTEFLDQLEPVEVEGDSACGRALRTRRRVVIEDVETDPEAVSFRALAARAGFRGVQSTPLFGPDGEPRGMLSTHFRQPHRPSERDLRLTDLYMRLAVELLEREAAREDLRTSRETLRSAERDAFRLGLSDALRPLADPGRIQAEATRLLRDHLDVGRVMYGELEDDTILVHADRCREGVPSAIGRHPLSAFGARLSESLRSGGTVTSPDVHEMAELTPQERSTYDRLGIRAFVAVPLVKEGRLTAILGVHETSPRRWMDEDVVLIEEVAERTWDAVERARAEAALRDAKRAAEDASEAKSRFLAMISHELRTPLSGVIGCATLLEEETLGELNAHQKDAASRIAANSWHLSEIIQEILTLSRMEAGRAEVQWEQVDVASVIQEVVGMLEPEARARRLAWRKVGVDAPVLVRTDPGKVRQILVNLVGNAVKYTQEGRITLRLACSVSGAVRIHVRDTGPGIRPEDQERIFEPFVQVDSSYTRNQMGTGLGLAIARRLARLLGGDITLRSAPGRGSTFTLHLPP